MFNWTISCNFRFYPHNFECFCTHIILVYKPTLYAYFYTCLHGLHKHEQEKGIIARFIVLWWYGMCILFCFVSEQIEMYFSLNCELDRFLTNITYTITWNVFYDTIFAQSLLSNVSVFRLVFFYNLQLGENGHWSTWNKESPNKCKWYSMPCK